MKAVCRPGIGGRPGLDFRCHSAWKPLRCQPMTVAGWMTRGPDQPDQTRLRMTRKTRSPQTGAPVSPDHIELITLWRNRSLTSAQIAADW